MTPISIPATSIPGWMFGANLVILDKICDELSCGQGKVHGRLSLGVNARGCWPTPSSRWRRILSLPRLVTGKFTDTPHSWETHTSWCYCRWYEEHWDGVSSRHRLSFSRDSNLKSCVVTRVVRISVFLVSRVTVFHVEGDATVDEGDACLIGQMVIDISRFHFCYLCLFCPLFNITRFKTQWTKPITGQCGN